MHIPVNVPLFSGRERELLVEAIETGWISSDGPFVRRFEDAFADFVGVRHGVAVCNGTVALEVGLWALGLRPGDEVILPTFTIISCAAAVLRLGGKPVLVDIDPETWTMDVSQVEGKIGPRTRALMPVHIYGHPVDMDPLLDVASRHGLRVLEDAAEVHGAEYKGRRCGSLGHAASFSFYANKIVTTGEGGMVVTDDEVVAERARSYRNLCFLAEERFHHEDLGYNFRMTNLQAAVGVAQTERIDEAIAIKRRIGDHYRRRLSEIPGVRFQPEKPWARTVYWMYSIELDDSVALDARQLRQRLEEQGIGTRPFFKGLHEQPVFHRMGLFLGERYPAAERAYRRGLYLPSGLTLTESDVDHVCEILAGVLAARR